MIYLKNTYPKFKNNEKWLTEKQNRTFAEWIKERVSVVNAPLYHYFIIVHW